MEPFIHFINSFIRSLRILHVIVFYVVMFCVVRGRRNLVCTTSPFKVCCTFPAFMQGHNEVRYRVDDITVSPIHKVSNSSLS